MTISKAAAIGGGVIGAGWVARLVLNGIDVSIFDPDPEASRKVGEVMKNARRAYKQILPGGLPKEGGIASLKPLYNRIAKAYLIGEAAPAFAATLGTDVPYEISGTLENAVRHAASDAEKDDVPGAVVMLSPACASFDQFKNFEVRGDAFVALVAGLDGISMLV